MANIIFTLLCKLRAAIIHLRDLNRRRGYILLSLLLLLLERPGDVGLARDGFTISARTAAVVLV